MKAELTAIDGRDDALARGALAVVESRTMYDLSAPIDADALLTMYSAAVEQAIADGFAGIRVAADITCLVEDPARRRAHLQWEQLADRYMTEQPLAPLCMYDRRRVADFRSIEHIHPLAGPDALMFSLHGTGPNRSALHGEIDALTAETLAEVLSTLPDGDDAIDASALTFLDGRGAWVVQQALARRRDAGRPLVLHDAPPLVQRVWDACGFDSTLLDR
jgi:anti-anti-sigma regulatory factor